MSNINDVSEAEYKGVRLSRLKIAFILNLPAPLPVKEFKVFPNPTRPRRQYMLILPYLSHRPCVRDFKERQKPIHRNMEFEEVSLKNGGGGGELKRGQI